MTELVYGLSLLTYILAYTDDLPATFVRDFIVFPLWRFCIELGLPISVTARDFCVLLFAFYTEIFYAGL